MSPVQVRTFPTLQYADFDGQGSGLEAPASNTTTSVASSAISLLITQSI
jgi:hypothetical protein